MAQKYLYSGATGTADGSSWTNAYTTMSAACSGMSAGDTCFVADDHNEFTAASVTVTSPGTYASPCRFICAKRSGGSVPPVSADLKQTGIVKVTGNSNGLTLNGVAYVYGIVFAAGTSTQTGSYLQICGAAGAYWVFDSCKLELVSTGTGQSIKFGYTSTSAGGTRVRMNNTLVKFGNTGATLQILNAAVDWIGTLGAGSNVINSGSMPTTLFGSTDVYPQLLHLRDLDLSALGSGNTLFAAFGTPQRVVMERCVLGSAASVAATQTTPGATIDLICCDSGTGSNRNERYMYGGVLTTDTTVVLTGGATDGFTPFSHKLVSNSNAGTYFTLDSFPMVEFYAGTLGATVSQTYELLTDNVALTNADAWVDLEYLGSTASPVGSKVSSGVADPLASSSALTTSTAVWATSGVTTPKPQKIVVSFTPQLVGLYRAVLKVAKASTTIWLNPPTNKAA